MVGCRHRYSTRFQTRVTSNLGALGIQGMALYNFEASKRLLILVRTVKPLLDLKAIDDILVDQSPDLAADRRSKLVRKNDPQRGIGSGLANTELGLRLRYEITRQFALTLVLRIACR